MPAYRALPWEGRLAVMRAVEAAGSAFYAGHVGDGFMVAFGRDVFGATCEAMAALGFTLHGPSIHTFPLGTDNPPGHLRHDSQQYGVARCNWLLGTFIPTA